MYTRRKNLKGPNFKRNIFSILNLNCNISPQFQGEIVRGELYICLNNSKSLLRRDYELNYPLGMVGKFYVFPVPLWNLPR